MVKRSLTNNIVVKKKKSPKKITKSPFSQKYNDYISKNKHDKKNEMKEMINKLSKENIKEIISKKTDGMGLGIFIAKNLIENIGGAILFSNHEYYGAKVEIKFKHDN